MTAALVLRPGGGSSLVKRGAAAVSPLAAVLCVVRFIASSPVFAVGFALVLLSLAAVVLRFELTATLSVDDDQVTYARLGFRDTLPSRSVWNVTVDVGRSQGYSALVIHGKGKSIRVGMLSQSSLPAGQAWVRARASQVIERLGGQDELLRRQLPSQVTDAPAFEQDHARPDPSDDRPPT